MSTLIRTGVLTHYFKVAKQLDLEPRPLLRKLGLSSEMLADPEHWISGSAAVTLLEESARLTQCPTFGLRMADLWQLSDLGVVSVLLTHQRTLRDALGTMIQYRHLMNEFLVIRIEETGRKVIVREDVVADEAGPTMQSVELALGTLSRMCSTLIGTSWHPLSVHFTHDAPDDLRLHRRIFGGKLEFASAFNGLICRAADLDRAARATIRGVASSVASRCTAGSGEPSAASRARRIASRSGSGSYGAKRAIAPDTTASSSRIPGRSEATIGRPAEIHVASAPEADISRKGHSATSVAARIASSSASGT